MLKKLPVSPRGSNAVGVNCLYLVYLSMVCAWLPVLSPFHPVCITCFSPYVRLVGVAGQLLLLLMYAVSVSGPWGCVWARRGAMVVHAQHGLGFHHQAGTSGGLSDSFCFSLLLSRVLSDTCQHL